MPPEAVAKGVAALAKAKAAADGKDTDFYEKEVALAVPGVLTEAVAQDASGAARGRGGPIGLQADCPCHGSSSSQVGMPLTAWAVAAVAKARACAAVTGMQALSLCSPLDKSESEPRLQPLSGERQRLGQMPLTAKAKAAVAKAGVCAAVVGIWAHILSSPRSSPESEPWLQQLSEERQRLRQIEPARGDKTAEALLGSPAGGRLGRQGAKADSDPSTCGEWWPCRQPCQRVCWVDSCCRTAATCYEVTGRTCIQQLHHRGPHRCGTYYDDAVGRGDCEVDGCSEGSGGEESDDDCKSQLLPVAPPAPKRAPAAARTAPGLHAAPAYWPALPRPTSSMQVLASQFGGCAPPPKLGVAPGYGIYLTGFLPLLSQEGAPGLPASPEEAGANAARSGKKEKTEKKPGKKKAVNDVLLHRAKGTDCQDASEENPSSSEERTALPRVKMKKAKDEEKHRGSSCNSPSSDDMRAELFRDAASLGSLVNRIQRVAQESPGALLDSGLKAMRGSLDPGSHQGSGDRKHGPAPHVTR